jgi:hypothetical protein
MPPRKIQNNSVITEPLRKHGAETNLNHRRSPTPTTEPTTDSQPNTSSRLKSTNPTVNVAGPISSDKSYIGAQQKRIVIQTQPSLYNINNKGMVDNIKEGYDDTNSSDATTQSSEETDSELSTTDTDNYSVEEDETYEPLSKIRKRQTLWPMSLAGMPMPTFTIKQDVNHYIADMTTYLGQYCQLPEVQKAKLIQTGVKGEALEQI